MSHDGFEALMGHLTCIKDNNGMSYYTGPTCFLVKSVHSFYQHGITTLYLGFVLMLVGY